MTDLRSRDELAGSVRARRGAHRPAPSRLAALVPVLLVLGAVGVLAAGVWLMTGLGGRGASDAVPSSATIAAPAPASGSPSAEAPAQGGVPLAPPPSPSSPAPAPEEPADQAPAAPEPSAPATTPSAAPEPPEEPAAEVDTDVPVVVLNATRTQGLAASTARDLEREGWTIASTGNERSGDVEQTVVRYPDRDLEATAAAVAALLGDEVSTVLDDDAESGSVTVVAGADQVE